MVSSATVMDVPGNFRAFTGSVSLKHGQADRGGLAASDFRAFTGSVSLKHFTSLPFPDASFGQAIVYPPVQSEAREGME